MPEMKDAAPDPRVDPAAAAAEAEEAAEQAAERVEVDLVALQGLQREHDELLDTTRRLQADFENYRKRVLREQTALVERATEGLIEQLLPVLDSFELAVREMQAEPTGGEAKPESTSERVRKGIELVFAELIAVLEKAGLERIDALGAPFDPNEHEAVMQDDGDGEPHVGDVMRTGWKLKGRVVRPAMVKVTRKP
jgi:molecular chaperone GrpE